jgi:hypothetical protein
MNLFFLPQPAKNKKDEPAKNTVTAIQEDPHYATEGGEFLDDAIRMKEQPFFRMRVEESIAPGCPDDLL